MRVILQKNKRSMGGCHLRVKAKEDTWTHSRRKRREALQKQKQQELSQVEERKRPHSPGEGNGLNSEENPAKRARMDVVCDGGMSWVEELCEDYIDRDGEAILIADIYVESQQKGYGGDSSSDEEGGYLSDFEDDEEDEEHRGKLNKSNEDGCEKMDAEDGGDGVDRLIISVNWIGGTDREQANRVLCYLKNRLK